MNKAQLILEKAQKYNNSEDMLFDIYGIKSNDIYDAIVVAPSWLPEKILKNYDIKINCLTRHAYFSSYIVDFEGLKLAWIQCASGANNLIDTVLTLANSRIDKIIFVGAVGSLCNKINLGDIVTPSESYAYEGGSIYLEGDLSNSKFGKVVKPYNIEYINKIITLANNKGINLTKHKVFCTDSILCEYSNLDFIHKTGAELIEMETAAFYRCMEMMSKNGMALLCVSDNSTLGISLVSRTKEETEHFHQSREQHIPELIKIICSN